MDKQSASLSAQDVCDECGAFKPRFLPRGGTSWTPHGQYRLFRDDGSILMDITYDSGFIDGPYCDYWSTGGVSSEGQFVQGRQHGVWHYYTDKGTLEEVVEFNHGEELRRMPRPLSHGPG